MRFLLDRVAGRAALMLQRARGAGVIVLYHRVSPEADAAYLPLAPAEFERHCAWLRANFRVVALSEIVERCGRGEPLGGLCAITFDDGYHDFLEHAYPILERLDLPVTHFLVAGCLLGGRPTWNLRFNRIVTYGGSVADVVGARERLARLPTPERDAWLAEQEMGFAAPVPEPAMLRPEDLACFDPRLVEWGSHTLSHADLAAVDRATAWRELATSRTRLEAATGRPIRYISYPNDSRAPETPRLAREAGYTAGLAVGYRAVGKREDLFVLPRFDVGAQRWLRLEVSGVFTALRRARGALNGGWR